jgi:hypothetical protein
MEVNWLFNGFNYLSNKLKGSWMYGMLVVLRCLVVYVDGGILIREE